MNADDDGVDVILVNYHGAHDILGAVASLRGHPCHTVQVVDNSVDGGQATALREGLAGQTLMSHAAPAARTPVPAAQGPHVQLHIAPQNLGFGQACNLAFAASGAPFVLLLNPDARLREGALTQLVQTLQAAPRAGAVAPRIDWTQEGQLVLPNLTAQSPAARMEQALACRWAAWRPRAFAHRGWRLAQRTMTAMHGSNAFAADALSGAVLLLRRQAVQQAAALMPSRQGLFDAAYFMFFEDTDLSQRLRLAGWQLWVQPQARAWHAWHNRLEKAGLMAQSERTYLQRYHRVGDLVQQRLVPRLFADPWRGHSEAVPVVRSAADLRLVVGPFVAITPLPMLHPAGVRADAVAREVSDEEWGLLDNGRWYACINGPLTHPGGKAAASWRRFDVMKD